MVLTLGVWPLRHKERSVPNYMPIKDSLQMSSLSLSLMAHVGRSGEDQAVRGRGYPISASDSTSATPPVSTPALRMEEFGRYSLLHTTCERLHAAMSTCRQIASSPHSTPHSTPHSPRCSASRLLSPYTSPYISLKPPHPTPTPAVLPRSRAPTHILSNWVNGVMPSRLCSTPCSSG